jgi:hypothetical protein
MLAEDTTMAITVACGRLVLSVEGCCGLQKSRKQSRWPEFALIDSGTLLYGIMNMALSWPSGVHRSEVVHAYQRDNTSRPGISDAARYLLYSLPSRKVPDRMTYECGANLEA